ncbi:MAG: efflux RND transporter periplasmic adaptor subunit [Pseudomonadota bacterium]
MTQPDPLSGTPGRQKKPTPLRGVVFIGAIALVAAGLGAFALSQRPAEGPLVPSKPPNAIVVSVQAAEIQPSFELDDRFSGLVSARRTSRIGFETGGRIVELNADLGARVAEGRRLAALDTRAIRAQLDAAKAVVNEAEAAHALAQVTVQRQQTLLDKGHVSPQRLDEAVAQADSALARIEAAKAEADILRVRLDLSVLRAPFSGVITERMVDEGAIATPGAPVFEIVEDTALEARIGLPADAAAGLKPGEAYTLDVNGNQIPAILRATTDVIDQTQRTITAVFDLADAVEARSGEVARLAVERSVSEDGFWTPLSSLTEGNRGLWAVYVAEPLSDGGYRAAPRAVEIVHSEADRAFVRGAVSNADLVIMEGLQRLTPGMRVAPTNRPSDVALAN